MKRASLLIGLAALALATGPADAEDFVIRGATVHTATTPGTLENTDVLVRDDTIVAVGPNLAAPPNARVIDAKGRPLTPGLFGGFSAIGLDEISEEPSTIDSSVNLKSPAWEQQWRPELDVTLAYNPRSALVPVARTEGVTWTVLAPASADSIVAGQGAAVSLDGRFDAVIPGSRILFVAMVGDGAKRAGGSRAAEFMLLDQAIQETRAHSGVGDRALLHPVGRKALARYLAGGKVVFEVDRAADILAVVVFARRNGMQPIIEGGSEAWVVARQLAETKTPVILDPLEDLPSSFDRLGASLENAARLQRAGVRIAFSNGDSANARLIRQLAGNAVAHGLDWSAALIAITAGPADILGIGGTRGKIAVGQVADLVLWSGDPLEVTSLADQLWIDGRPVSLESRQTALRDRYFERPKAHQAR
jgi:hypothetical protein